MKFVLILGLLLAGCTFNTTVVDGDDAHVSSTSGENDPQGKLSIPAIGLP